MTLATVHAVSSISHTGSDHDLLMMTFHLRLKRISKPKHTRLKFDLEFQAIIGGKFASLTIMNNEDTDMDSMITTFNKAMTETASEILANIVIRREKPNWVTAEIFDLCDKDKIPTCRI